MSSEGGDETSAGGEEGYFQFSSRGGGSGSSLEQPNKIEVSPYDKLLAMHYTGWQG